MSLRYIADEALPAWGASIVLDYLRRDRRLINGDKVMSEVAIRANIQMESRTESARWLESVLAGGERVIPLVPLLPPKGGWPGVTTPIVKRLEDYPKILAALQQWTEEERTARLRYLCQTDLIFFAALRLQRRRHGTFVAVRALQRVQVSPNGHLDLWF